MAYLFGAFKNSVNVEDEGPTLVACHTKHLQDQLFYKDLPQLAETLDVPIKAVMMKGRTNYICKTRFNWLISDSRTLDGLDVEALIPLLFWMRWTKTGDLSECSLILVEHGSNQLFQVNPVFVPVKFVKIMMGVIMGN